MSNNKKQNSNALKKYLKSQTIYVGVYLIIFFLFSLISTAADINIKYMPYISLVFIGLASFITGFSAGLKERKNGIVCGIIASSPLNALLIILSVLYNRFAIDIFTLVTVAAAILLSALGGIVSVNVRLK